MIPTSPIGYFVRDVSLHVNQIDLQSNPQFPSKFFTDIFYQSAKLESPIFLLG